MLGRLFLLFTLTTTVELVLLLLVGRYVSIPFTIALIVLTGLLGAYLASREGRRAWRRVTESMSRGELPADPIVQALLVLAGGLLLLTPGLLTDATGFACLLPPSRAWLSRRVRVYLAKRTKIAPLAVDPTPEPAERESDPNRRRGVVDVTDQQ
jgi:UPF0716 protein FxsA